MSTGPSLLSAADADALLVALHEELLVLEASLARFHELPPGQRLPCPEDYRHQIEVRRELLVLLDRVNR